MKHITPKVSILMPVYNSEKFVLEAIDSILNQSFTDFEFIIVDDASTDQTLNIIKSCNRSWGHKNNKKNDINKQMLKYFLKG